MLAFAQAKHINVDCYIKKCWLLKVDRACKWGKLKKTWEEILKANLKMLKTHGSHDKRLRWLMIHCAWEDLSIKTKIQYAKSILFLLVTQTALASSLHILTPSLPSLFCLCSTLWLNIWEQNWHVTLPDFFVLPVISFSFWTSYILYFTLSSLHTLFSLITFLHLYLSPLTFPSW